MWFCVQSRVAILAWAVARGWGVPETCLATYPLQHTEIAAYCMSPTAAGSLDTQTGDEL